MFEKIIGNEHIKESLIKAVNSSSVSHSYLFIGKSGIGKKLFAKELAKKVMCLGDETCESCIKFEANSNPDFQIIVPDGRTLKIEQIRNLQARMIEKPIISNKKVYIIDDAECMSEEAQNCLLKTLEEPPEYAMIILISSNENRILQTIKSRCVIIKFEDLTDKQIADYLNIQDKEIIKLCGGSLEKASKIQENKDTYLQLKNFANALETSSLIECFDISKMFTALKDNILEILDYLNIIFFEKANANIKFAKAISTIEKTKKKIMANNNFDMSIDYMVIHIWEEFHGKSSRS